MDHTPKKQNQSAGAVGLDMAFAAQCSNLYSTIGSTGGLLFGSLNVIRRNDGDWLALCKVTRLESMSKEIAFGAGRSYTEALIALNKTIAAGHWKVDKPWSART